MSYEYAFLARYRYQSREIEVPFTIPDGRLSEGAVRELIAAFHDMHERIYAFNDLNDVVAELSRLGIQGRPAVAEERAAEEAGRQRTRRRRIGPVPFSAPGGQVGKQNWSCRILLRSPLHSAMLPA